VSWHGGCAVRHHAPFRTLHCVVTQMPQAVPVVFGTLWGYHTFFCCCSCSDGDTDVMGVPQDAQLLMLYENWAVRDAPASFAPDLLMATLPTVGALVLGHVNNGECVHFQVRNRERVNDGKSAWCVYSLGFSGDNGFTLSPVAHPMPIVVQCSPPDSMADVVFAGAGGLAWLRNTVCGPGTYGVRGVAPCQPCRAGYAGPWVGLGAETQDLCGGPCQPGRFSEAGWEACEACRPGYVCPEEASTNSIVVLCGAGEFFSVLDVCTARFVIDEVAL
jgi:hypothetical protein